MELWKKAAAATAVAIAVGFGGATAANALPGGNWSSASAPLPVNYAGWKPAGYSYGTFEGLVEGSSTGDRIQGWSAERAVKGYNGDDRGAYTKYNWYWNGSYCYTSSYSVAFGEDASASIQTACTNGWNANGNSQSGSNNSSTWDYWNTWVDPEAQANSVRAKIQTCWNVVAAPDSCSSNSFLRGVNYGG